MAGPIWINNKYYESTEDLAISEGIDQRLVEFYLNQGIRDSNLILLSKAAASLINDPKLEDFSGSVELTKYSEKPTEVNEPNEDDTDKIVEKNEEYRMVELLEREARLTASDIMESLEDTLADFERSPLGELQKDENYKLGFAHAIDMVRKQYRLMK
ncbi:hypothetical protein ABNZ43_04615 [Weissella sp. GP1]|uniref:hypothetical protein n=1 Tax=Weissella confusa TaxID=1583 RepID=UPI0032DAD0B3